MDTTIPETLDRAARLQPDDAFLRLTGGDVSFARMRDLSERLATSLAHLGVRSGDRVAIAATNSTEWLATCFAVLRLGATVVAVNVAYRQHELDHMLNHSEASVWVCPTRHGEFDYAGFVREFLPRVPTIRHVVFLGDDATEHHTWHELAGIEPDADAVDAASGGSITPDQPAFILYTSGTTGEPKGATLTHQSMLAAAHAQSVHFGYTRDDVVIGHMPLNHVGGITCTVLSALISGSGVALVPSFHPRSAVAAVRDHEITLFVGVPTMYTMLLGLPEFEELDTSSVRLCIVGGSQLTPTLAEHIARAFPSAQLANLYGLSESSGACVLSSAHDTVADVSESLGVAIGDVQLRTIDDAGEPVVPGETGELQVRSACVAAGYWEQPDHTAATFGPDGWLATGDMAVLRADGHVVLRGRAHEMFVQGGYNIYPAEIESIVTRHRGVAMAASIGVPDPVYGSVGHCYVLPRTGHEVQAGELADLCRDHLADHKVPRGFTITAELPLTQAGKIHKAELARDW